MLLQQLLRAEDESTNEGNSLLQVHTYVGPIGKGHLQLATAESNGGTNFGFEAGTGNLGSAPVGLGKSLAYERSCRSLVPGSLRMGWPGLCWQNGNHLGEAERLVSGSKPPG